MMRFLALGVVSFCLATPGLWAQGDPLTVDQIVQLIKEGVSERIVIEKLRQDGCECRASAMEIMILRGADASDELIREVIAASSRGVRRPEGAPRTDPAPDPTLQEFPRLEVMGGWNWLRFDGGESLWGWQVEGQGNFNRWVGIFGEFSHQPGELKFVDLFTGITVQKLDVNVIHLHTGPKVTFRNQHLTGFIRGGLGFTRISVNDEVAGISISASDTGLSWVAGAGLDVNVTPGFAVRVIQADYLGARFSNVFGSDVAQLQTGLRVRVQRAVDAGPWAFPVATKRVHFNCRSDGPAPGPLIPAREWRRGDESTRSELLRHPAAEQERSRLVDNKDL